MHIIINLQLYYVIFRNLNICEMTVLNLSVDCIGDNGMLWRGEHSALLASPLMPTHSVKLNSSLPDSGTILALPCLLPCTIMAMSVLPRGPALVVHPSHSNNQTICVLLILSQLKARQGEDKAQCWFLHLPPSTHTHLNLNMHALHFVCTCATYWVKRSHYQ